MLVPTEDSYTSGVTLPATTLLRSASAARITNKPCYYYSRPVLCTVAKSNATVGHQFIAWFSGKALWRAEGFFSLCSLAADQEPDMARNPWLGELNVGMFGGVGSRRKGFFFHCRSMKFEMLINDACRDVDLTMCLPSSNCMLHNSI